MFYTEAKKIISVQSYKAFLMMTIVYKAIWTLQPMSLNELNVPFFCLMEISLHEVSYTRTVENV